jgi:hypothetical protein
MKCLNCNKDLTGRQTKYCCNQCQTDYQYKEYISLWKANQVDGLSGQFGISKYLKRYFLEKANYQCELCGWGETNPFTQKKPLELHHKDGNYKNNSEDNLILLCPNCHSLTDSYRGGNIGNSTREGREKYASRKNYCIDCGIEINSTSTRCHSCENKTRIQEKPVSREDLKALIRKLPFTQIGILYKVSDNTIRKWCDYYNLPRSRKEIQKISDEKWENI